MELTPQQEQAFKMIKDFIAAKDSQVFILKGYAGTGKTTLICHIIEYLSTQFLNAHLFAPTGRAAKVLRSKLPGCEASTIHRGIYQFSHLINKESEGVFKYIFPLRSNKDKGLYIVDEASMVSSHKSDSEIFQFGSGVLMDDLLTYVRLHFGGKIIFVGDPLQLPPVGDNHSVALDESYFKTLELNTSSYELTDVIRQDDNSCILVNATMIREIFNTKERNHLVFEKKEGEVMDMCAMDVAKHYYENQKQSSAIICFSNQQAADYNVAVRSLLFPGANHVVAKDRLMVVFNSYDGESELLNGDLITVDEVSNETVSQSAPVWTEKNGVKKQEIITLVFRKIKFTAEDGVEYERYIIDSLLQNKLPSLSVDETKALYINSVMRIRKEKGLKDPKSEEFAAAMGMDPFFTALRVKYGYAFTCHKSQGGEWNTVYVDFSKRTGLDSDSLRWKYTAVTRASKTLWCVNLPDVTPMSGIKINPILSTKKIPNNALALENVEETPFHNSSVLLPVKVKYWSVFKNMLGTPFSINKVESKPWREIYEVHTPDGLARVDAVYNGAGVFTKYDAKVDIQNLLSLFRDEDNIKYKIDYQPSLESLNVLYHRMISLCDELGITLTNVVEENYKVAYFMKASGNFASLTFFFNAKGFINYAAPLSDVGEEDEKLVQLIHKLA